MVSGISLPCYCSTMDFLLFFLVRSTMDFLMMMLFFFIGPWSKDINDDAFRKRVNPFLRLMLPAPT